MEGRPEERAAQGSYRVIFGRIGVVTPAEVTGIESETTESEGLDDPRTSGRAGTKSSEVGMVFYLSRGAILTAFVEWREDVIDGNQGYRSDLRIYYKDEVGREQLAASYDTVWPKKLSLTDLKRGGSDSVMLTLAFATGGLSFK